MRGHRIHAFRISDRGAADAASRPVGADLGCASAPSISANVKIGPEPPLGRRKRPSLVGIKREGQEEFCQEKCVE